MSFVHVVSSEEQMSMNGRESPSTNPTPSNEKPIADPQSWGRVSRNAKCPCGSGKKYKHCCGRF